MLPAVAKSATADLTPLIDPDALKAYLEREARHWGGRVRQRREDLGLTLEQVATLAGTTTQTIFKIEKGEISPRDHVRVGLAWALSTEVDRLFPLPSRAVMAKELGL
jgi:DNA-binding XRE family transcriptional regulator